MGCNCKHSRADIEKSKQIISHLREAFVHRLTVDSEHNDKRRKDFNQAIFDAREGWACFNNTSLDMILAAFDAAQRDYIGTFCDEAGCRRSKTDALTGGEK